MAMDVIDEYWLYLNPYLLGEGVAYFRGQTRRKLRLAETKAFPGGVVRLHYTKETR
jgi:hypothetical protein